MRRILLLARHLVAAAALTVAPSFHRGNDVFSLREAVSAADIVNVLGRWRSYKDWDGIGELVEIDALFDDAGRELVKLKAQQSSGLLAKKPGNGEWVAKTPQRRGWCIRNGLVQRVWFKENVGLLPFADERMAKSVGATAAELNATPLCPLAADVVFDALSTSQSGIIQRELCDERRAAYQAPDGAFEPEAFAADLSYARFTVAKSFAIFPGSTVLLQLGLFIRLDGMGQARDYLDQTLDVLLPAYLGIER